MDYVAYLYQKMDPLPEQERFEVVHALLQTKPYLFHKLICTFSLLQIVFGRGNCYFVDLISPLLSAWLQGLPTVAFASMSSSLPILIFT